MHLRLSDQPAIERPDGGVMPLAPRDAALLAWLAVEGPTSRDRLCGLLWPASSDPQARTTLRQRLFQLKKALGHDVAAGSPVLALADGVRHDLAESAELLGDLALPDAPELDGWLRRQRAQRHGLENDALRAQAQALEDAGDVAGALPVAQAVLRREPLSEAAHQRVMRLHYVLGDRAAALTAFDACEQTLKDEVGTRPSQQTLELLATIEAAGTAPGATDASAARSLPVAVLRPPAMVGRSGELRALQQAWAGAQVAAVIGEAGIGKSRLLAEFIAGFTAASTQGRAGPSDVVRVAGRPGDAGVPFAMLARLLRAVGERGTDPPLAPELRRQVARVLPEFVEAGAGWGSGFGPGSGETQRLQLQRALATYLHGATGLAGLVLDDLHFADAASLELLPALITAEHPADHAAEHGALRWVLAFRPAEAHTALQALLDLLAESVCLAPITVTALDEPALAALVNQLGLGLDGVALAARLRQRTGGNPLFVLEMLKQSWAEGRIAQLHSGAELPRTRSVGQLIERRVARLSPQALSLARVASIAGVDFGLSLAEAVLGTPSMLFADALAELEGAQVFRGLQFAHDLVFDAVRQGVPAAVAAHTHGKVAAHLEHHQGSAARVAQHWVAAGDGRSALPWLRRAADESMAALRMREAFLFLDRLAEIHEVLGDRGLAFEVRDEVLGALDAAMETAHERERQFERLEALADDEPLRIRACLARCRHAHQCLKVDAAEALARQALAAATALGHSALQRASQLELFAALQVTGRADEALSLADQCLPWIDEIDEPNLKLKFHVGMGLCLDSVGRLSSSQSHLQKAMEIAHEHADVPVVISLIGNLSNVRDKLGQLRVAVAMRRQALSMAAGAEGGLRSMAVIQCNLAFALVQLGQYSEALRLCDASEADFVHHKPAALPLVWAFRGRCWLQLGQRSRALQAARQVLAATDAMPLARVRGHTLGYALSQASAAADMAQLDAALALMPGAAMWGQRLLVQIEQALLLPPEQALAALDDVRDRARQSEFSGHVLETHLRAAQVALQLDPARASAHATAALSMAESFDFVASYRGELWLHCARALHAAGRTEQALAVAASGRDWVLQTARDQVPPEFQDSFLRRNPTNAALLALTLTLTVP